MRATWEKQLSRWAGAGLVDATTAERIRTFEAAAVGQQKFRWPVLVALSLGGLLLGAGVLLFVAAHWDNLSPATRFLLVLLLVAVFHAGGALAAERFNPLSTVLHAVGTVTLGAGIFMAGQIFNLEEHWPGGVMLWAAGAWAGWWLRRDWVQASFVALLTPGWLLGEWSVATEYLHGRSLIPAEFTLLLAITYLTARVGSDASTVRKALVWAGGIAIIPATLILIWSRELWTEGEPLVPGWLRLIGWMGAIGLPLALAYWLRRRNTWLNVLAALWAVVLGTMIRVEPLQVGQGVSGAAYFWYHVAPYLWCAVGSVALVAWGLYEERRERINLGFIGFAITVLSFYFSNVMDKLGRSASMIGLGILFLAGGWWLERMRRRLVARM